MYKYKGKKYRAIEAVIENLWQDKEHSKKYDEYYEREKDVLAEKYSKEIMRNIVELFIDDGIVEEEE